VSQILAQSLKGKEPALVGAPAQEASASAPVVAAPVDAAPAPVDAAPAPAPVDVTPTSESVPTVDPAPNPEAPGA
jgi:hypothetical protein